ncbi:MAG: thiamine phosphate synthase [Polyangiaceae bacterium]
MRGLYAILDTTALEARRLPMVEVARAVSKAGVACVQVRAKELGARASLELVRSVVAAADGVPVIANDRPDVALLASAAGVHVGQDDVPPGLAKFVAEQRAGRLIVGLSTHDREQLLAALDEPIDYVAIGPVFATSSKDRPDPVIGLDAALALAREAHDRRADLPVCAIGGIGLETAGELAAEFDLVAVIGALLSGVSTADEVGARARELVEVVYGAAARRSAAPS